MVEFFNAIKTRCDGQTWTKPDKADFVQAKASRLLDVFTMSQCEESVNYYLHCAFHHLPDIIRRLPIEVDDASGCCIEHAHQTVKQAML